MQRKSKSSYETSDDEWGEERGYRSGAKERGARRSVVAQQARTTGGRSRPTNNQLLCVPCKPLSIHLHRNCFLGWAMGLAGALHV